MGIEYIYPLFSDQKLSQFKYPRETIYKKPKKKHLRMFRKHSFEFEQIKFTNISNYKTSLKDKIFILFRCPNCLSIIDIYFDSSLKKNFIYFNCYCGDVRVEINEFMNYYLSNPIKEVYCDNHEKKKAVCYFKNLFKFLCDDCYKYYKDIYEEKENQIFYSLNKVFLSCKEHNLNFYSFCFTCGQNYCLKCTEHKNHNIMKFEDYIKINNISYKEIYNLLKYNMVHKITYHQKLNDYKIFLNERELNELTSYFNKNTFSNCQLYYLGELVCFIYEYNRYNLCYQFICNMKNLYNKQPSNELLDDLNKKNNKNIVIDAFKKVMNISLISSIKNRDILYYLIIEPSPNYCFFFSKTKFDIMNSNLYIALDNGKIYYNQRQSKEILYFDNDNPFDDEKPKKLFEYDKNIEFYFEIKKLKLLGIASDKSFLLYDYENKKKFQEIEIDIKNNDYIHSIIELSNLMIAININKKEINFYKFDNEKKKYFNIYEPMKKIKEKVSLNNFEIYSGSNNFIIVKILCIYFFRLINDNFILQNIYQTISQAYFPKNINIYSDQIYFITIIKNYVNMIIGFYLYSYCLKSFQTITSTFQRWELGNLNTSNFGITNNDFLYISSNNTILFINKLTFENIECLNNVKNNVYNLVETKNHHFLYYNLENKTSLIHHNQYKNLYRK